MSPTPKKQAQKANSKSVTVLREAAEAFMQDERERGRALDAKTASLATFAGTILTLNGALGTFSLRKDLGCVGDVAMPIFFLVASVALLASAGAAIGGVLLPQKYLAASEKTVKRFARFPMASMNPTRIELQLISTISDQHLPRERERNNKKATWAKAAVVGLVLGLFGIGGEALTLAINQLGV